MPFLLSLLGVGKGLLGFALSLIKALFRFAQRRPLLALALLIDVALLSGCWWGYQQHGVSERRGTQITQLKQDLKQKDSLIDQLFTRVREYSQALTEAQQERVKDVEEHNRAVAALREQADSQLREAERIASETRKQRDYFFRLAEQYRKPGANCGDAAKRIACEEALNERFITDMQKRKR